MRKLKIGLAVVAAALALLLAVAFLVDFRAPALGRRILDAAGAGAGIEIQAARFRINLVRGIVLEEVVATTRIPSGTVVATLDRVVLQHRLLPLIYGDIVIDRLVLERPVIEVINDGALAARSGGSHTDPEHRTVRVSLAKATSPITRVSLTRQEADSSPAGRAVTVHSASITDGTLLLREAGGEPTTRVEKLDVELSGIEIEEGAASVAVGLFGRGHIDIGEVRIGARTATGNRAQLAADGGVFTVTGLVLTTPEGRLTLEELLVDLNPDPYTFRTSLSGEDLDLNGLINAPNVDSLGPVRIEMEAAGTGADTGTIVGGGTIYLSAGRIPDAPFLDQVASVVGLQLAGLAYEATTIEFRLGDDRVDVAPFEIVSEAVRLEANGQLAVDGVLDGRARISVERGNIDLGGWGGDFADALIDALTDDSGWTSIPLVVGGTIEDPSIRPDSEALLAVLQESAGNSLGRLLQGLIKRDD